MLTEAEVWAALAEVEDPEIPVVSVVDMGVVRNVRVHGEHVHVEFTPTFLGCPALEAMRDRMAARRVLYETADEIRITALMESSDARVAGLATKINREEAYHRMHAEMWRERLAETPQFRAAVDELWPYALGLLPAKQRDALAARLGRERVDAVERGTHTPDLADLWDEMTMVRRSAPAGSQW